MVREANWNTGRLQSGCEFRSGKGLGAALAVEPVNMSISIALFPEWKPDLSEALLRRANGGTQIKHNWKTMEPWGSTFSPNVCVNYIHTVEEAEHWSERHTQAHTAPPAGGHHSIVQKKCKGPCLRLL